MMITHMNETNEHHFHQKGVTSGDLMPKYYVVRIVYMSLVVRLSKKLEKNSIVSHEFQNIPNQL